MTAAPALLRLFARPALTAQEFEAAPCAREAREDAYAELTRSALASGVAGLVHKNLARFAPAAPLAAADATALRGAYRATLADNMRRLHTTDIVHAALASRGIDTVLVKGAALVETHYGDLGLRPMRDADLLLRPHDLAAAEQILDDFGFRRRRTPGRERSEDEHYQRGYLREKERIELHVALCDSRRYPVDVDGLWARARTTPWRGRTAVVPDDADHLAYVALHAALHGFILPMSCLVDVSILLRRSDDSVTLIAHACERARSWRAGTAVYLAFALARALTGAPISNEALGALRPDPVRAAYLRACFHADRMPAFRYGDSIRLAQTLALFPLMDGGRARYLTHYGRLRIADVLARDHRK